MPAPLCPDSPQHHRTQTQQHSGPHLFLRSRATPRKCIQEPDHPGTPFSPEGSTVRRRGANSRVRCSQPPGGRSCPPKPGSLPAAAPVRSPAAEQPSFANCSPWQGQENQLFIKLLLLLLASWVLPDEKEHLRGLTPRVLLGTFVVGFVLRGSGEFVFSPSDRSLNCLCCFPFHWLFDCRYQ